MSDADDLQLLRALRQGETQAVQTLYRRHRQGLYRYALLHGGRPELAADVVQEVFMGLIDDSYRFDPLRGMLGPFLFGVARKLVLRQLEQQQRWVHEGEDEAEQAGDECHEPLARLLGDEAAERLRQALARVAPHYRDVLILYELEELSYQEIATVCDLDLGTVRSRLARGRAALSRAMGRE